MSMTWVLAAVFAALLVPAVLFSWLAQSQDWRPQLGRLIERYGPRREVTPDGGDRPAPGVAVGWAERMLGRFGEAERRLAERLDHGGIRRSPAEWVLLGGGGCIVLVTLLTPLTGSVLVAVPLGVAAGWLGLRLFLSLRINRRRAAFAEQLPNVLQLIASSLQSGFSLAQALDAVVREEAQPIAGEFARALAEARLGVDLAVALDRVADRMASDDLRWAVMTVRIVRQVGGNLSQVLETTVGTMRERSFLRRHVRALSAEGRLSAYILSALPALIAGWMFLTSRSYVRPLYSTPFGVAMLVFALVMFVTGAFWMRKLIKVVM